MFSGFEERVKRAVDSIREVESVSPQLGIVLGSGLGDFIDRFSGREIPYTEIDGFPLPTVEGHRGTLKISPAAAVLAGRFHYYEGYDSDDVVLPIFLLHGLGVRTLIVTNAAGAVNPAYKPGELVLIRDHVNLMGVNPLRGPNIADLGPRFPDMSEVYSSQLRQLVNSISKQRYKEGVYAAFQGPCYETPAEIRMAAAFGADLVGMSTVPEVIAAAYLGIRVIGISCVTNMAAGILEQPLSHEEVVATGKKVAPQFAELITSILNSLSG